MVLLFSKKKPFKLDYITRWFAYKDSVRNPCLKFVLRFIWNLRKWNRRSSTISTKKHFDRLKTLFDYSWIGWMVKSDFGLMMRFWIKPEWRAYITFFEKERPSALVSRTWLNFNTMLQQKHITFHKAHTRTTHQTDRTNERKRKGDRVGESQSGKERERQQYS